MCLNHVISKKAVSYINFFTEVPLRAVTSIQSFSQAMPKTESQAAERTPVHLFEVQKYTWQVASQYVLRLSMNVEKTEICFFRFSTTILLVLSARLSILART
ncbi:uncharacterized protein RAG0_05738 [Rhynchosporium agropyri]|uniref:Uncharacterized protein n=1 Tax=Rhynchosporium agropyri TaxID=914238 RepID=A0A1E1KEB2_9HELO|nr:uncharacterized protein RAG0_05738 [Rhynchosporium agropyri]